MKKKQYINIFPCIKLVKGYNKAALYDLQREEYYLIPLSMCRIIEFLKDKTIEDLKSEDERHIEYIDQYIKFLIKNELCFIDEEKIPFIPISDELRISKRISTAVFDYDKKNAYDIENAIQQLNSLLIESLELRFYDSITIDYLDKILLSAEGTTLRDIEVMVQYNTDFSYEAIISLRYKHARLRKVTVTSAPEQLNHVYFHEEMVLIYTSEIIRSEKCCGVVNEWYFLPKIELYVESLHVNNCLYGKISIDKNGFIKNCPSIDKNFGNIHDVTLYDAAQNSSFEELWRIRKDDIDVCKDCELRYLCQDCRAYITDKNNIYSKPAKCNYDPYK